MEQMLERGSEEREMNVKGNASDLRVEKNKEIFSSFYLRIYAGLTAMKRPIKFGFYRP